MLLESLDRTLPESHTSGRCSLHGLDATWIWYAVCRPSESLQLRFGLASPTPIGFVCVSTRKSRTRASASRPPAAALAGEPRITSAQGITSAAVRTVADRRRRHPRLRDVRLTISPSGGADPSGGVEPAECPPVRRSGVADYE